ncbi:MAG: methyltransferase domain-containing protein [Bacteroidetes bacterium]|nr:methyltransferase domain-containing protein [Bacteroidota bacterium]
MSISRFIRSRVNIKFSFIRKSFGNRPFRLLDVGAGNHSASKFTSVFPACEYYGLDMDKTYNNDQSDFSSMKGFYELDLTKLDYSTVPDNYFDGIWMAHVIEHLYNGDQVLPGLLNKLKSGGYFYIEYPGKKSTTLPSMRGTLNFKDDPTHVRVYSVPELKQIFEAHGCEVLQSGTRRNWYYIIFLPVRVIISLLQRGFVQGNVFWDLLGFAEYLWVKKR